MQIIEAGASNQHYWRSLWAKRSLLYYLSRKDLSVRYKQTFVGVAWVMIRPFLIMVVFTMIFGAIAQLDSNGLPYGFVVFAGVLPWYLFASLFAETSGSFISGLSRLYSIILFIGFNDDLVSHCSQLANHLFPSLYYDVRLYSDWAGPYCRYF